MEESFKHLCLHWHTLKKIFLRYLTKCFVFHISKMQPDSALTVVLFESNHFSGIVLWQIYFPHMPFWLVALAIVLTDNEAEDQHLREMHILKPWYVAGKCRANTCIQLLHQLCWLHWLTGGRGMTGPEQHHISWVLTLNHWLGWQRIIDETPQSPEHCLGRPTPPTA